MIRDKRRVIKLGRSKGITLPHELDIGSEVTIVADGIGLIDFRGDFSERELLEFYEDYIEPLFTRWLLKKRGGKNEIRCSQ